jgi:hypothetical protein
MAKFKIAWIKIDVNIEGHPYHEPPFPYPLILRVAKKIYSNTPATLPGVLENSRPRATEPRFNQGKIIETKELRLIALL